MGFGFVQYFHKSCADAALKNLQQSELDGKSLELKRSERTLKSANGLLNSQINYNFMFVGKKLNSQERL